MESMTKKMVDYCEGRGLSYEPECNRCGARLDVEKLTWLELDSSTGAFHTPGSKDLGGNSQGCFEFGSKCARMALKGK